MPMFGDGSAPKIISVAVPRPLYGLFTYKLPSHLESQIRIGGWVKVPFGRAVTHAFVVEEPRTLDEAPSGVQIEKLKEVLEVGDSNWTLSPDVMALCRWAHEYYCVPLGEVLNCAAPSAALGMKSEGKRKRKEKPVIYEDFESPVLTEEQNQAFDILDSLRKQKGKVGLLNGVTGSGKTEIYIELAKKTLEEGKGVLILVPEIALTPQLHHRIERGLKVPVALWHSAVARGKRKAQSEDLRAGKIKVVVGARSAVFAPVQNLGLIVVDEEHDPTFKQEDRVRYHARDLAVVRGKFTQALVVLGSATPSIETRERVREGRYFEAKLTRRIAPGGLPKIEFVDLRTESMIDTIRASLATKTIQTVRETLAAGEQVIIYLNRRGFAAFLLCQECGEVNGCPDCSISLTVYKRASELRCHICGHKEAIPHFCKKCQGTSLQEMGAGTESLEDELPQLLPEAQILRLDRDQITSATRLSSILESFRKREANILLGTQMLVKGHDFPGVTLVVVVMADTLFRWPDFRSPERAYQILKQVSGRAGRGEKAGRVLIQTYDPEHPVLQVMEGNIPESNFIEGERELRAALGYPPFSRLARLRFESPSPEEAILRAKSVTQLLNERIKSYPESLQNLEILGPSEAFLKRAKGIYRWDVLLKSKTVDSLQRALHLAREISLKNKWQFLADVDPYGV